MRLIVSDKYRQAYLDHDINAMAAARADLRKLRVTDKQNAGIKKDAHLSSAQKAFRHLPNADKIEILKKMPPEERAKWLKLMSPTAVEELKHARSVP